ncbi:hypothetical protein K2173_011116 [Erythroxylum novogranatense]|uniref:EF-hand domain-containing protein n=1 Tax=Erythroxylum novogranatense TaxID=1862640 RepID=A0AAV8U4Z9_9ROSI|nr:hypothetical protein K2173_011116 [Erythroxylum novogranatense]
MSSTPNKLFLFLFLFLFITTVHSRSLPDLLSKGMGSSDLLADGLHSPYLILEKESSCEHSYGFLPCTKTVLGNLFLILVYGYLMFLAATYSSTGSELLLEILGPGIVGGLFLPLLGALPDAMLILVESRLEWALMAGLTVMLLTLIWGSCVIVGKCDIRDTDDVAIDGRNTEGFSLTGSGVSTDIWTCYAARIMAVSVIPFLVVELSQALHSSSGRHLPILIGLILSLSMLIFYCLYQVFQPWIQRRRLAYAKLKHVISGILQHLKQRALGRLLTDDGQPNEDVIRKLFEAIDENNDKKLSSCELRALIIGIRFEEIGGLHKDEVVAEVMRNFGTSNDESIDEDEFVAGVIKWLSEARRAGASASDPGPHTLKFINDFHVQTRREHALLGPKQQEEEQSDEAVEVVDNPRKIMIKAMLMLLLGTVIAAVFADPLVDAVDNFSDATSIPNFFISFIVLPLAKSREAVSAITSASRKKIRTSSLTFSDLYGAVTMNNLLCLSVFLALVCIRGLTWDFSSEVLVICIVCIVMGDLRASALHFPSGHLA